MPRFVVSLFPQGVAGKTLKDIASVFLAREDDARCLCWAALCGAEPYRELILRSGEMGYGLYYCWTSSDAESGATFLEKAVAQGEPEALFELGRRLWEGVAGVACDKQRAEKLWRESAELGFAHAQYEYAMCCCLINSLEQSMSFRRSAIQHCDKAVDRLSLSVAAQLKMYDYSIVGVGRILFEYVAGLAGNRPRWSWLYGQSEIGSYCDRAVTLYIQWCANAKTAVLCWLWLAREKGVSKDIRLVIADLIWEQQSAWAQSRIGSGLN